MTWRVAAMAAGIKFEYATFTITAHANGYVSPFYATKLLLVHPKLSAEVYGWVAFRARRITSSLVQRCILINEDS
jgi:hypothetical protein